MQLSSDFSELLSLFASHRVKKIWQSLLRLAWFGADWCAWGEKIAPWIGDRRLA